MQIDKHSINCIYFDVKKDKCNCPALKTWYGGKPKCVLRVDWNSFCKHKLYV